MNVFTGSSRRHTVGLQDGAKSLLKNMIRHTDTHNRLLEEAEMWHAHSKMRASNSGAVSPDDDDRQRRKRKAPPDHKSVGSREPRVQNSFLFDDRRTVDSVRRTGRGVNRRAHMDDGGNDEDNLRDNSGGNYWQRQLMKAEEEDGDRWGHGGFKELYPREFGSDCSGSEHDAPKAKTKKDVTKVKKKRKKKDKKRKHKKDEKGMKKVKMHHKSVVQKGLGHERCGDSGDSFSDREKNNKKDKRRKRRKERSSEDSLPDNEHKTYKRIKKRKKHKESDTNASNTETDYEDSFSDYEHERYKKKKKRRKKKRKESDTSSASDSETKSGVKKNSTKWQNISTFISKDSFSSIAPVSTCSKHSLRYSHSSESS